MLNFNSVVGARTPSGPAKAVKVDGITKWSASASGPPEVTEITLTDWEAPSAPHIYMNAHDVITLAAVTNPYYLLFDGIASTPEYRAISTDPLNYPASIPINNHNQGIGLCKTEINSIFTTQNILTATAGAWDTADLPLAFDRGTYLQDRVLDSGKAFVWSPYSGMVSKDIATSPFEALVGIPEGYRPYSFDYDEVNGFGFSVPRKNGDVSGHEGALIAGDNDTVTMKGLPFSSHWLSSLVVNGKIFAVNGDVGVMTSTDRANSWNSLESAKNIPFAELRRIMGNVYGDGIIISNVGVYYTRNGFDTIDQLLPEDPRFASSFLIGYMDKLSKKAVIHGRNSHTKMFVVDFS